MKNFDLINRRTHLYLSFVLLPWFFMYGISSLIISHNSWFRDANGPQWTVLFEKEYDYPIQDGDDIRQIGQAILEEHGFRGAFWANRPNKNRLNMSQFSFWTVNRLTYWINENRLVAEKQIVSWDQILLRMHFRGGFIQPFFLNDLWAWIVDLVCLSIILWIVTGLILWWKIQKYRRWGIAAISGGIISFLLLMLGL